MKILQVADIHYTLKQLDWLGEIGGKFDLVVIAGDLLDIVSIVDLDTQILVVMKYLQRLNPEVKLIVSSGNHDLDEESESGERYAGWMEKVRELGVPTDGDSCEVGGILFTICPWWDGDALKEKVEQQLAADSEREKGRWFWVYHAPPVETKTSWDGKRDFGDTALRDWIAKYQPELVLSGHIHQAPFAKGGCWFDRIGETWIVNNGKQPGPVPAFSVIDTEERTVQWLSLAGRESLNFESGEHVVEA